MITTSRLDIIFWNLNLTKAFWLAQDQGFTSYQIKNYKQSSLYSAREWISQEMELNQQTYMGKMAVIEESTGALIGLGGLTPWKLGDEDLVDITYRLRESAWGKGYGIELARALVDHGFNHLKLKQITATITPDNEPSKIIAAKLGMVYDRRIMLMGVPTDVYRLTR